MNCHVTLHEYACEMLADHINGIIASGDRIPHDHCVCVTCLTDDDADQTAGEARSYDIVLMDAESDMAADSISVDRDCSFADVYAMLADARDTYRRECLIQNAMRI